MLCWAELLNMVEIKQGLVRLNTVVFERITQEDPDSGLPISNNILIPQQVHICGVIGLAETKSEISDRLHFAVLIQTTYLKNIYNLIYHFVFPPLISFNDTKTQDDANKLLPST